MAELTVAKLSRSGQFFETPQSTDLANECDNNGRVFLFVYAVAGVNITFDAQNECTHGYDDNEAVTLSAGQRKIIGPFPSGLFNDADGHLNWTYNTTGGVYHKAYQLGGT